MYTKEAQDNIGLRFDAPKRENWTYKKYIKHVSIRDKEIRGKYMPQDTENIMSVYEIITTVIAVIALLQPWIIMFYNHFLKKICVSFIPSAQIKLYYNRSGAYVYLGGVIESKNQAALVKDISVKVIRQNDKAELNLGWSSFMVPVFQSIGGNSVTTSEIARPFKVEAGDLYPVFIEFASVNIQDNSRRSEIYNIMASEAFNITRSIVTIEQAKQMLVNSQHYQAFRDELLQDFYWKEADYIIELSITYNEGKTKQYRYKFSIDANEAAMFNENIEKLLKGSIDDIYRVPTNLFYPQKDFVPAED